ncbi:hypothetical protein Tco_1053257 [Tanacetum coccineum]
MRRWIGFVMVGVEWWMVECWHWNLERVIVCVGQEEWWRCCEGSGGDSFWKEDDGFEVDVLRFHACLTDILGFLEKLRWQSMVWIEEDAKDGLAGKGSASLRL